MRRLLALVVLLAACGGEAAVSTAPEEPPSTFTTSTSFVEEPTTTVADATTTSTEVQPQVLGELEPITPGFTNRTNLRVGQTYSMAFDGFTLRVTPPMDDWALLAFQQSTAAFWWEGPSGFYGGTLEVLVWDVGVDGVGAAWSRIEAVRAEFFVIDESLDDFDWEWTWVESGIASIGDREVEWREVRTPPHPNPDIGYFAKVSEIGHASLPPESSFRFYVVPVGDLTVTVMGWESRCADCERGPSRRADHIDDVENELSMWIAELEAFLASLEFVES